MKLPGQRKWSAGTYAGKVDELSYIVKVGDVEFQGNRKQLVSGHEDPLTELPDPSELTLSCITHEVQPLATYIARKRVGQKSISVRDQSPPFKNSTVLATLFVGDHLESCSNYLRSIIRKSSRLGIIWGASLYKSIIGWSLTQSIDTIAVKLVYVLALYGRLFRAKMETLRIKMPTKVPNWAKLKSRSKSLKSQKKTWAQRTPEVC